MDAFPDCDVAIASYGYLVAAPWLDDVARNCSAAPCRPLPPNPRRGHTLAVRKAGFMRQSGAESVGAEGIEEFVCSRERGTAR